MEANQLTGAPRISQNANSVSSSADLARNNIVWLRPDAIGDNVLASSMLPFIKQHFLSAYIHVICQEHIAEIYHACPYVDEVIAFNRGRLLSNDIEYRNSLFKKTS